MYKQDSMTEGTMLPAWKLTKQKETAGNLDSLKFHHMNCDKDSKGFQTLIEPDFFWKSSR